MNLTNQATKDAAREKAEAIARFETELETRLEELKLQLLAQVCCSYPWYHESYYVYILTTKTGHLTLYV